MNYLGLINCHRADWLSGNALNSCSEGTGFELWPAIEINVSRGLPQYLQVNIGQVPRLAYDQFLINPFGFNNYHIFRRVYSLDINTVAENRIKMN
jgi:hypothetical protein